MKKVFLLLVAAIAYTSCGDGTEIFGADPIEFNIAGKWIWSPSENRADANSMYEFLDGIRYTYYCITCPADDAYWNSLTTADALPTNNPYTFENDTLRVDLHFGNELVTKISYDCDGGKLLMDGQFSNLWRLDSDCQ